MTLDTPIGKLYGVGPKYEKCFNSNSIYTIKDLLYYFPRAYQNRGDIRSVADPILDSEPHAYILTVASDAKSADIRRGLNILKFKAFDDTGTVTITFFNQSYLKDVFKVGATFRFWGKIVQEKRTLCMNSPSYEPCTMAKPLAPYISVYPLFSGVNQKYLAKLLSQLRGDISTLVTDYLPESIRLKNKLCTLAYALENIHFPENSDALERAIRRLTFDELFIFALSISQMKQATRESTAPIMIKQDLTPLLSQMPYELTGAQRRTVEELEADMCLKKAISAPSSEERYIAEVMTTKPMNRIIVGDVGSGKTICAAVGAYIACKSGYQCALMVPTEILAFQHFEDLCPLFERVGISCELLTGSTPARAKKAILERLKSGKTQFIIGTHALIQTGVEFNRLGLVITDEQHRFGVRQRASLAEKSQSAHVLVMSATPIPRTLSLMIYGDLDISLIDEMPKGRQRVDTFVVDESYRARLNAFIRKQVNEGHQAYVVCPSVEEKKDDILDSADFNPFILDFNDTPPLKSAVDYSKVLAEELPDLRVAFLHGKMKSREKDEVMMAFANGEIDVLVSTTVIEVGVNVPNATLMIVENAERFGLSQLHQLRGRVGRGSDKSYCILVSSTNSERSRERLEIMRTTYDGYTIAERDLKMRGPGDFFSSSPSIRQSGEMSFTIAKSCSDEVLLHSAFESARELLCVDKALSLPEHSLLLAKVLEVCEVGKKTIN